MDLKKYCYPDKLPKKFNTAVIWNVNGQLAVHHKYGTEHINLDVSNRFTIVFEHQITEMIHVALQMPNQWVVLKR